jgi:site-specific recombinase XerD
MNLHKKFQIFISSTYIDLIEARSQVTEKILSMYQFPIGMEMFSAGNDNQWTVIKRTIDISDYYVLIIGHRYGSTTDDGTSYTEKEYEYALEKGIPILAFIRDRNVPTTPDQREKDLNSEKKLDAFIDRVQNNLLCEYWHKEEDLASKVSVALMKSFIENPRDGWVRANFGKKVDTAKNQSLGNLEAYIVNYLEEKRRLGLKDNTLNGYQLELKLFFEFFKEEKVENINTNQLKSYLIFREDNYGIKSKSTLERVRSILKTFFDWLVEEQIIERNPVKKIKPYRYSEGNKEPLEEKEVLEVKDACKTLRERALIELLLSTGCRLGELRNIRKKNINWDKGTVEIIGTENRDRIVLLNDSAQFHLEKYLDFRTDDTDLLFVTERKPNRILSNRGIQRTVDEIVKRTNIKKRVSPSIFRHTFAKRMINEGYSLNVIQALLGNKNYTSTSETYIKVTHENINNLLSIKRR